MTFFYERDTDELIGNVADEYAHIDDEGSLHIDVSWIYEEGRGTEKLEEIKWAAEDAIEAHEP